MPQFTLEQIEQLCSVIGNGAKGSHMLVVIDGCLCLTKKTHSSPGDNLIARISADEIRNGLTSKRWDAIASYLKDYNAKHHA